MLTAIQEIEKSKFNEKLTIARYTATLSKQYSDKNEINEANKFIKEIQKLIDPDWVNREAKKGITMLKNMINMGLKGK